MLHLFFVFGSLLFSIQIPMAFECTVRCTVRSTFFCSECRIWMRAYLWFYDFATTSIIFINCVFVQIYQSVLHTYFWFLHTYFWLFVFVSYTFLLPATHCPELLSHAIQTLFTSPSLNPLEFTCALQYSIRRFSLVALSKCTHTHTTFSVHSRLRNFHRIFILGGHVLFWRPDHISSIHKTRVCVRNILRQY